MTRLGDFLHFGQLFKAFGTDYQSALEKHNNNISGTKLSLSKVSSYLGTKTKTEFVAKTILQY